MDKSCENCKHAAKSAVEFPCNVCSANYVDKWEQKTNADRIRSMSDEELAEFLCGVFDEGSAKFICGITIPNYDEENILRWLKSESDTQ